MCSPITMNLVMSSYLIFLFNLLSFKFNLFKYLHWRSVFSLLLEKEEAGERGQREKYRCEKYPLVASCTLKFNLKFTCSKVHSLFLLLWSFECSLTLYFYNFPKCLINIIMHHITLIRLASFWSSFKALHVH